MAEPVVQYALNSVLAAWGGVSVVLGGLAGWLGAVAAGRIARRESQAQAEQLESLKAELSRTNEAVKARHGAHLETVVWVDKVRFEHEYEAYRKAWAALDRAQLGIVGLVSNNDLPMQTRLDHYLDRNSDLYDASTKEEPFLDSGVSAALADARLQFLQIFTETKQSGRTEFSISEVDEHFTKVTASVDKVAAAIRARLEAVRILQ